MPQGGEDIALRWLEMGSGRYACTKRILHNYNKRRLRQLHALENRHNKKQKKGRPFDLPFWRCVGDSNT